MLPEITNILNHHFGKGSKRIIGVTGSMLPPFMQTNDVDWNIGGTIGAINAFYRIQQTRGITFAYFHGNIYIDNELKKLNLHRPEYDPRFANVFAQSR